MNATVEKPAELKSADWTFVRALIQDVMREHRPEDFAAAYAEWNLAIRQFRKVEEKRIILQKPTPADWREYDACLDRLLAQGRKLVAESGAIPPEELKQLGMTREEIRAGVEILEIDWRGRHPVTSARELEAIRRRIFGVET